MCVCVRERERERGREGGRQKEGRRGGGGERIGGREGSRGEHASELPDTCFTLLQLPSLPESLESRCESTVNTEKKVSRHSLRWQNQKWLAMGLSVSVRLRPLK